MKTLNVFVAIYKQATEGMNIFVRIITVFVLAVIFVTVISAWVNVIQSILVYQF